MRLAVSIKTKWLKWSQLKNQDWSINLTRWIRSLSLEALGTIWAELITGHCLPFLGAFQYSGKFLKREHTKPLTASRGRITAHVLSKLYIFFVYICMTVVNLTRSGWWQLQSLAWQQRAWEGNTPWIRYQDTTHTFTHTLLPGGDFKLAIYVLACFF